MLRPYLVEASLTIGYAARTVPRQVMIPVTEIIPPGTPTSLRSETARHCSHPPMGKRDKGKPAERRGRKAFEANARACRRAPCRSGCRTYPRGSSCAPAAAGGPALASLCRYFSPPSPHPPAGRRARRSAPTRSRPTRRSTSPRCRPTSSRTATSSSSSRARRMLRASRASSCSSTVAGCGTLTRPH